MSWGHLVGFACMLQIQAELVCTDRLSLLYATHVSTMVRLIE